MSNAIFGEFYHLTRDKASVFLFTALFLLYWRSCVSVTYVYPYHPQISSDTTCV